MSVSDIYANARGLGAYLKEKSAEIDEARRLPPEVVARVHDAGVLRLAMPKDWGAPELSTIEQVRFEFAPSLCFRRPRGVLPLRLRRFDQSRLELCRQL